MRKLDAVSIHERHRGYNQWKQALDEGMHIHVTLDGVHQGGSVISANVTAGWVHQTKITGEIVDNKITPRNYTVVNDEWGEETVYGVVEIEARLP